LTDGLCLFSDLWTVQRAGPEPDLLEEAGDGPVFPGSFRRVLTIPSWLCPQFRDSM
jgi:hypothetical protein